MHSNHTYNLMCQLVEEQKSLWRITNCYLKDTEGCPDCATFWEKLKKDKEEHIADLTELLKKQLT